MNPTPFFLSILQHLLHLLLSTLPLSLDILRDKVPVEVTPSTLASQVGVIGRWDQADRLCRTNVLVAEVMSTLLHHIDIEVVLVVDDDVMGWSNLPLKTGMCLQVEVEQERRREASVLDCTRKGVSVV